MRDPVSLVYNDGFYYLIAYNRNQKLIKTYRVDRCEQIKIESADVNNQNAKEFLNEFVPTVRGVKQDAEIKDIQTVVEHLSEVLKITSGISLRFNLEKETVTLLNGTNQFLDEINIADDSSYGVLEDIMAHVLRNQE